MTHRRLTNEEHIKLERLIDVTSVSDVLQAIVTICGAKAYHIREQNPKDKDATKWERRGKALDRLILPTDLRRLGL